TTSSRAVSIRETVPPFSLPTRARPAPAGAATDARIKKTEMRAVIAALSSNHAEIAHHHPVLVLQIVAVEHEALGNAARGLRRHGGLRQRREPRGQRRRAHRSTVDTQREKRQLRAILQSTLRGAAGGAFTNRLGRERRIALARGVAVARGGAPGVMARVEPEAHRDKSAPPAQIDGDIDALAGVQEHALELAGRREKAAVRA